MMKIPVECWSIPQSDVIDRIHVFWMDSSANAGYVTIICYGHAWTAYFGAMGGKTIREFFASCDVHYLVGKMGITPMLKQSKKNREYLGRIIFAVKDALKKEQL